VDPWVQALRLSADTGATFSTVSTLDPSALLAVPQGGVLVGTDTTGIHLFTDNGDSVGKLNEGLTELHIHSFALDSSGYVYAGTNHGVWRRPVSDLVVSVNPMANRVPQEFFLNQNYPNPFNPSTTIRYGLPVRSHVTLSIFNTLGQQVATLVQGEQEAGYHEAVFDASGLASGVYLYRLQVGDFVQTKKLVLVH
jgi:hypothetical protein